MRPIATGKVAWSICLLVCQDREPCNKSSAVAEMGNRGHNRHGQKEGAAVPLSRTPETTSNTMWTVSRSTSVPSGDWHVHPSSHLATIDMGQKLGGGRCAFFLEVAGSPLNTKSPEPRPTSIPSGILSILPIGHNRHWPQIAALSI